MAQLQQLDIPAANGKFFVIPKNQPGRLNVDNFIFFNIPRNVDPGDYKVAISTLDTSAPGYRTIGDLQQSVELPFVQHGAHGKVMVIPTTNSNLPRFYARLNKGSTYDIPNVRSAGHGATFEMQRHGVLTAGVSE